MKKPLIVVNTKTYQKGTGKELAELYTAAKEVGAWIAVQNTDIRSAKRAGVTVYAQHVDAITYGSHTGHVLPEAVKEAGARGTLINHAEKKVSQKVLKEIVKRCKEVGLQTIVCADSIQEAKKIARYKPDYIALEPPELIGGEVSITEADPDIITQAVQEIPIPLLVGAGVKNKKDVQTALRLGAVGVLLASGVISKPKNSAQALKKLV